MANNTGTNNPSALYFCNKYATSLSAIFGLDINS